MGFNLKNDMEKVDKSTIKMNILLSILKSSSLLKPGKDIIMLTYQPNKFIRAFHLFANVESPVLKGNLY